MENFKFYLITDTHYFKNSLGAYGAEYDKFMRYEQKCFAETQSINEAVFDWLENAHEAKTVFIAGDLSFNGEKESHLEFIRHLHKLRESGKKIYVITADHDFKEHPFAFDDTGRLEPEGTSRDELFDLYYEFGFSDAIALDREHLSYVAQLCDGVRLLALNNDGSRTGKREFDEAQLEWILEQTKKAREDGQMMIAMNHYPLIPAQPIMSLVNTSYQRGSYDVLTMLADEGVHLVFTGHMHNQSINYIDTQKGNRIYDICTGSIIADPSVIRLVEIKDEHTAEIKTYDAPDFEWDTKGKSCKKYLEDLFDNMILNTFLDIENDPYNFMRKVGAGDKTKLFPIVKKLGKILNHITVGRLARLLMIKCDKSIKDMLLRDYAKELVRQVFEGNQTFKEGTPKGDLFLAFIGRMKPFLKKVKAKTFDGKPADICDLLKNSAGNYDIDDYNAELKF